MSPPGGRLRVLAFATLREHPAPSPVHRPFGLRTQARWRARDSEDAVKELPLNRGYVAIVDDDVFEWASRFKWTVTRGWNTHYAVRRKKYPDGTKKSVRLHREITKARLGNRIDHINGDGLDNRRSNLRFATNQQNGRNARKQVRATSSRFKGVSFSRVATKWEAYIKVDYKKRHIGLYLTEEEAAAAYDDAARELFGEFAALNIPRQRERAASV